MNASEQTLLDLLEDNHLHTGNPHFYELNEEDNGYLFPAEMAHLYISAALLVTALAFLTDQLWLRDEQDKKDGVRTSYRDFITPFFLNELAPIVFLKEFLITAGAKKIKGVLKDAVAIENKVLALVNERSGDENRAFAVQSLKEMTEHFLLEEAEQEGRPSSLGHKGLCLYRTFDKLDEVFSLNYQLDRDMEVNPFARERLYQRAGVGVQSGYSTILLALHRIESKDGSTFIDLGSGYGRVGLVCALLRPDIQVTGYEFVPHRVDVSNNATRSLGLQDSLRFQVQDLSSESFRIPIADVYYLYDPFTEETYRYVLEQIVALSRKKRITVVTKGNARSWLMDISKQNDWHAPELFDNGNLCIFRSSRPGDGLNLIPTKNPHGKLSKKLPSWDQK